MANRTDERAQFLSDLIVGSIEHAGYGFPGVKEFKYEPNGDARGTYAVIYDRYEDPNGIGKTWRVDIDLIAKGLRIFREAHKGDGYADWVKDLILCDRTNGDDGDYDVVGALAVLESAIFGEVVYN